LFTIAGATFVGVAATALFAAPASAHHAFYTPATSCETRHGESVVKVHWEIHQDFNKAFTFENVKASPALTGDEVGDGKKVQPDKTVSGDQWVKPGDDATLSFDAVWSDKTQKVPTQTVKTGGVCKPDCPPAAGNPGDAGHKPPKDDCKPPCRPAAGDDKTGTDGRGGKPPAPPECPPTEGTPSKSSSSPAAPAAPAKPTLPVTGSQAAVYGGGSAVLLGAGAGLFFVARRRRIRFEA
jgi:LPXTG-motif cell wall-anchored protein